MTQFRSSPEPGSLLTPEEGVVREALREYAESRSVRDWVPTETLYAVYKRYHFDGPQPLPGDPRPNLLDIRHFGVLLGEMFPHTVQVRRRTKKRHVRGRAFLIGPLALRMGER